MGNQALSPEPTVGNAYDHRSTSEIVATEVSGSHVVTIDGYSWTTKVDRDQCIPLSSFTTAGHRWSLRYYPNGRSCIVDNVYGYISIFLSCDMDDVYARCTFSLVDEDGTPTNIRSTRDRSYVCTVNNRNSMGFAKFIKSEDLEQHHVRDDRFRIRCDISVLKLVVQREEDASAVTKFVDVPPSDILQDVSYLLSSGDGADVMFEVDGETFRAHRSILAARSPVLKAELFSPMKEGTATCVWVQDMEPRVFKALLHFIYNDMLPAEIDEEGETMAMAQHLLVAADRYCLERLKLICEDKLCGYIDTSSVGTMLALAERHGCDGLKKACLSFLMSGGNLKAAIVSGGLEHVMSSCPSLVKEFLMKSCSE